MVIYNGSILKVIGEERLDGERSGKCTLCGNFGRTVKRK